MEQPGLANPVAGTSVPGSLSRPADEVELDYRYERKAFVTELSYAEIETVVRTHPALFREIYHRRTINNIYFDSVDLGSFKANVDGDEDRVKTRLRWYGALFGKMERPVLELKIKHNTLGRKERYRVGAIDLALGFSMRDVVAAIAASPELPPEVALSFRAQSGVLLNRYSRRYFRSSCRRFRLTLDRDLELYSLRAWGNRLLNRARERQAVVVEIKYDHEHDRDADRITAGFPFALTKSSKYVHGLERLWG